MDWFTFAKTDYEINQDPERLQDYVDFGKITQVQYETIVKEG